MRPSTPPSGPPTSRAGATSARIPCRDLLRPAWARRARGACAAAAVAAFVCSLAAGLLTQSVTAAAPNQQAPGASPAPEGRVLLIPDPGISASARDVVLGRAAGIPALGPAMRDALSETSGVRVQNLGRRPTRLMAFYHRPPGAATDGTPECAGCPYVDAVCGAPLPPGTSERVPLFRYDAAGEIAGLLASVVTLSEVPARAGGPDWIDYLDEAGLVGDETMADVVCHAYRERIGQPPLAGSACPSSELAAALLRGGPAPFAPQLTTAPLLGEPIGGIVSTISPIGDQDQPSATIDRYRAPDAAELGWADAVTDPTGTADLPFVYEVPGAFGRNPEGLRSAAHALHMGAGCATIRVRAFRPGGSTSAGVTDTVGAGTWHTIDAWRNDLGVFGAMGLRLESDRPLAVALSSRSYGFSGARAVPRYRGASRVQLLPMAYQAFRPFLSTQQTDAHRPDGARVRPQGLDALRIPRLGGGVASRTVGHGTPHAIAGPRPAALMDARGWESNVSIRNPSEAMREVRMRLQAAGEPPRDIGYPLDEQGHVVLQPGLGLGQPGGVGWAEFRSEPPGGPALAIAVDSLRMATDVAFPIAGWSLTTIGHDGAPTATRAIGLPDLGGPAVGDPTGAVTSPLDILVQTASLTDTLAARIAIQNPTTSTARVAIDSYAACGHAGSITRSIDPRQAIIVNVRDLPGSALGANSAVVRILEGDAAAQVEVQRPGRFASDGAPLDLASAWRGVPTSIGPAPPADPAPLEVTPATIAFDAREARRTADLDIDAGPGACARWSATATAPWLHVTPNSGIAPATLVVELDHTALPPFASERTSEIRIQDGSGRTITVPVRVTNIPVAPPRIYIPRADAGSR